MGFRSGLMALFGGLRSYRVRHPARHYIPDAVKLRVDVVIDESIPLIKRVQGTQDGHDLLGQSAAVSGRQGGLRTRLPPTYRTL